MLWWNVQPPTLRSALAYAAATLRGVFAPPPTPLDRTRRAAEFAGIKTAKAPRRPQPQFGWTLNEIIAARDDQMLGNFARAVDLARAMRTDDALYVAYHNRIAPQSAVGSALKAANGARGEACARRAAQSVFIPRTVLSGIAGTLANHGIAIGQNIQVVNENGTRVDFHHTEWPLEHVRWNPSRRVLETTVEGGPRETITHGDGQWTVYQKTDALPWTQEAAVLPGSLVWGAHAFGLTDWCAGSKSHGSAKVLGTLPSGVSLQSADADGKVILSPDAQAYLDMLVDLVSGEAGAGIAPFGGDADWIANSSNMYQVFSELIVNREKAAARVYLGTDAILGSVGGAPGVDIAALFAIASSKIQGDFTAIEQGANVGVYQPWAAINEGDSRYAPSLEYQLPDPDAAGKSEEQSKKRTRLFDALDRMRSLNLEVTQADVNHLAAEIGVSDPPRLGSRGAGQLQLPDTAIPGLTLGREGREAQGLPPFGDERDAMTLDEITIYAKGRADAAVAKAKAASTGEAGLASPTGGGNTAPKA